MKSSRIYDNIKIKIKKKEKLLVKIRKDRIKKSILE
jgi:hypothetical protein